MSIVTNTSKPESTLKMKSNSICYHAVREAVAMGEALVAHIPTKKNLADLFTKVLYGQTQRFLVSRMRCSGMCSLDIMSLSSWGAGVRLMTGPATPTLGVFCPGGTWPSLGGLIK
eukprot:CCRYP_002084-RA/>CCRYP_002084-RA protein AED:0.57 eAED:0.25 QI:0/-1/0/1/-1/0/1/0/114